MKKNLFIFLFLIGTFMFCANVKAESVTHHTDLFNYITFDVEQIAKENNFDVTGNYILAKRNNGTDVILLLELSGSNFYYNRTNEAVRAKDTSDNDTNLIIMIYDDSSKSFVYLDTMTGFKIYKSNFYYDTTDCTSLSAEVKETELLNNFFINRDSISYDESVIQNAYDSFEIDKINYDYIIFYYQHYLYCYKWEKKSIFLVEPSISFLDYTGNQSKFWFNFLIKIQDDSGLNYMISYDLENNKLISIDNYIYVSTNIISFDYNSNNELSYSSSAYRVVETTIDLKLGTNALADYNDMAFNPERISILNISNDYVCYLIKKENILFYSSLDPSWIPKNYTYENLIDTTMLNQIEFSFKIPTNNNTFSFDLELLTQFSDIYLSKPYLEYSDIYGNVTISQIDDFLGERTKVDATDLNGNELYQYNGTFGIDFNELYELRLIFDVSNYTDDLYIKFTSSLDYDVNYINTIDVIDNYITVMMNDKYGLYLIPKVLTSDNFSNINLNGKYNIEIRNNYNGSEQYDVLKTYKNYIEPNFQYKYTFNNLNYLIYFENTEYNTENDDRYYITFDTRYYNYAIREFMFDEPTIHNPNTDEDYILNDNYTFDVDDGESFFGLISESFESFIPCIKEIFNLITIYFNGLPLILKCFYVFIFFMMLAYIIIKFLI